MIPMGSEGLIPETSAQMSSAQHDRTPPPVDWQRVRHRLRRVLLGRLDSSDMGELDDLVQEGCIRLLRALRRESIDDTEALATVIADRTFKDFLRRRYRNRRILSRFDDTEHDFADQKEIHDQLMVDMLERLEFVIVELFATEGRNECAEMARHWFALKDWKQLATRLDQSHAAVRKRWSRCLELPKERLAADPEYRHLFQWK